jgi:hypothetical protein
MKPYSFKKILFDKEEAKDQDELFEGVLKFSN